MPTSAMYSATTLLYEARFSPKPSAVSVSACSMLFCVTANASRPKAARLDVSSKSENPADLRRDPNINPGVAHSRLEIKHLGIFSMERCHKMYFFRHDSFSQQPYRLRKAAAGQLHHQIDSAAALADAFLAATFS